jgi:F0F1-type ATP synthase membrane subunit b/b'
MKRILERMEINGTVLLWHMASMTIILAILSGIHTHNTQSAIKALQKTVEQTK